MDDGDQIHIQCNKRINQWAPPHGNYFRDGRTKIGRQHRDSKAARFFWVFLYPITTCISCIVDFVLVWEVRSRRKRRGGKEKEEEEQQADVKVESSRSERRKAQMAQWREKFVQNLQSAGLLMEKVPEIETPHHPARLFTVASITTEHTHTRFLSLFLVVPP